MSFVSAMAATYTAQEQANRKVVADFYAALDRGDAQHDLKRKIRGIAERYLGRGYIQHDEMMRSYGPGREGFIRLFKSMPSPPSGPPGAAALPSPKVLALMANGDLVIRVSTRTVRAPGGKGVMTGYIFNMFRVQDGRLVEHWDAANAPMVPNGNCGVPGAAVKGTPGPQSHLMPPK
jgi:predicted SnoaL-like aldol condensation-catalyzing enzyme